MFVLTERVSLCSAVPGLCSDGRAERPSRRLPARDLPLPYSHRQEVLLSHW